MRILITGSSGRIGAAIAEQLSANHEVTGIDVAPGKWTQHLMSIEDRDAVFRRVRGVNSIIHTASLHHPQLTTHSRQSFVSTNITGTLNMLEAAVQAGVQRFVYTSTTSVYGFAMVPHEEAVWVTENLAPQPRDIYDTTKITAEELCRNIAASTGMPTICLRVSRFFAQSPELQALYRLYRGVDVRDAARSHILALANHDTTFDIFNISARTPFLKSDLPLLLHDPVSVLQKRAPQVIEAFAQRQWKLPTRIDRVYVTEKAEQHLGYQPRYGFDEYLEELDHQK
jgi:UDP-glucose 4-epimerase